MNGSKQKKRTKNIDVASHDDGKWWLDMTMASHHSESLSHRGKEFFSLKYNHL